MSAVASTVTYTRGRIEGDRLTRALITAAAAGQRPNCSDAGSWLWLSEDPADRAEAALRCRGCPVFEPCGTAAEARQEKFGTWGGRDRTKAPGKKAAA
jgi:Transcription factor WhiB